MQFKVGTVTVNITWHFAALITFMLSLKTQTVMYTLIFSMLHEIGHLIAMIVLKNKPVSVSFELTGINILRNESTGISLLGEILIAFAGPLFNLILFFVSVLLYHQNGNEKIMSASSVNLVLAVFNLLPVKGLDGGKILYYSISKILSFKIAKIILYTTSVIFICIILCFGIYVLYVTKYNFTMLIISLLLLLSMFSPEEC